jgi:hypothetical protein
LTTGANEPTMTSGYLNAAQRGELIHRMGHVFIDHPLQPARLSLDAPQSALHRVLLTLSSSPSTEVAELTIAAVRSDLGRRRP